MPGRSEQRRLALIARQADEAFSSGYSTLRATIHASADDLQRVLNVGDVKLLADYTPAQRRFMAQSGHAMNDGSFPIGECDDLLDAIYSLNHVEGEWRDRVEEHIRRRIQVMGCTGIALSAWR